MCACDTVTDHYRTLEEARNDRLFERGWLPDILPQSTVNIVTSNDVDIGQSVGSFSFSVEDGRKFFARLNNGLPPESEYKNWSEVVAEFPSETYSYKWLKGERATWAFFCIESEGTCTYYAW